LRLLWLLLRHAAIVRSAPRGPDGHLRPASAGQSTSGATLGRVLRKFLTPRWLALHLLVVVLVVVFCRLGWWQARRAGEGNALSVGYALEWPVFAAFTVFVWYRTVRDTLRPPPDAATPAAPAYALPVLPARPAAPAVGEDEDPELAAYNRYLASLADTGGPECKAP
jgi:DNA-binding transcriptional regulator of glucitol operon